MAEGIGSWKSFEDLEDHLVLDELIMISEALNTKKKHEMKFMASLQGVEWDDDEGDSPEFDDELPPELIAAEKEWQRKKAAKLSENGGLDGLGLGYKKLSKDEIET